MVAFATAGYNSGDPSVDEGTRFLSGLDALARLALVGSEWAGFASPVAGSGRRAVAKEVAEEASERLANPIPRRAARVIRLRDVETAKKIEESRVLPYTHLGRAGDSDVFITAASDIRHLKTARGLARRLALLDDAGNLDVRPMLVLEFDTPLIGIASPVFRNIPGFVGRGRTAGGAREFVVPNLPLSQLRNLTWRIVY